MQDVVVIGGGLAGLATAALLAGRGHKITLLEKAAAVGGRLRYARKQDFALGSGFWFNGPERGAVWRVLNTCGLYARSDFLGIPAATCFMAVEDKIFPQPLTPWLTWTNSYLTLNQRWAYYNLVNSVSRSKPARVRNHNLSVADWLARHAPEPYSRELWLKLLSLLTYDPNSLDLSAADLLEFLQSTNRNRFAGLYFKGGIERLIPLLRDAIIEVNPANQVRTEATVEAILLNKATIIGVRLTTGEVLEACTLVCTPPAPAIATLLLPGTPLHQEVATASQLEGTGLLRLELGFESKIPLTPPTLYDLASQVLLTDLTFYDETLAPANGQLLQFQAFLSQQEALDIKISGINKAEQQILKLADKYLAGWRKAKVVARWTLEPTAVTARHTLTQLDKLLPTRSKVAQNLFYAGDSVGAKGILSESTFEGAERAAIAVDEFLNRS